jgi:hypothetical protein
VIKGRELGALAGLFCKYGRPHRDRETLKLNRPDVGWYQVRKALQSRNTSGDFTPVSFANFESAYEALTEKLRPMVYELGFLRA